ncbi:hypothetical protein [Bergeyella cardium]|mgnify:CR=1 FL=1|uniref:Uncharacterized protein n=1 Tax=Bergeyella cardium TaxID=1585976 RepID=A0A6P1QVL1_9FLAO|nr:hypothetical protein [Bergeyella cardium]QHN64861.1 hypothetical protein DBX24_02610 [Bergeyella cardium]WHE34170.1 hypothetical protein P8603_02630 [Bergeyella cardium]WHF60821.1 hypothetical protein O0R51_02625 [Bergeyella cardium]
MDLKDFQKNILNDVRVELKDEFDRNFERKAFFDKKWPITKLINNRGSLMMRSGNLRRGFQAKIQDNKITFSNSQPYASIHNEGGKIVVTAKMKRYFWAKYYEIIGSSTKTITSKVSKNKRIQRLSIEASQWKSLALMPIGKVIKVEERRIIGEHPQVKRCIKRVVDSNLKELNRTILKNLKK